MWISLFTVVLAVAVSFAIGALLIESNQTNTRRYTRRRGTRARG